MDSSEQCPVSKGQCPGIILELVEPMLVGKKNYFRINFWDTLDVISFPDPKLAGVIIYLSDFSKRITDRLQGDFFSDPSTASITCVANGPVVIAEDIEKGISGEEVFSEAKSLLFKSLKVRRIYDIKNHNLVYVSFSEKLMAGDDSNKSRFKSSLCAVHIENK